MSFIYLEGTHSVQTLHSRYRFINVKYFKQILRGSFDPNKLTKLGYGLGHRWTTDSPQDSRGVIHLVQCFGVYAMAVIYFAQPSARFDLTWALKEYRYRLIDYSYSYQFNSLKQYNYAFMRARIGEGQENATAWRTEDHRCVIYLRLKVSPNESMKPSQDQGTKSTPPGYGVCRNFNDGRCTREHCKYTHIYLNCQQNYLFITC